MATKKDLIEAQGFSRRRLLTAFTSGAPGGKELDPAKPLRAVIAGVVLTAMLVVGGVFYGSVRPGLPKDWQNNTVILAKDTGSRYVSSGGKLYPVLNATSARLLVPAGKYKPVTTDSKTISKIPVGPPVGIVGAPDDVPPAAGLVSDGWTACPVASRVALSIPGDSSVAATTGGALVTSDGVRYVIAGQNRYRINEEDADAVLRAVGLATETPIPVDSRWLNLFAEGAPFEPIVVTNAGAKIAGVPYEVGTVVKSQGSTNQFLITSKGELAAMSPLSYQLYLLGTGALMGGERDVAPGDILSLHNANAPAGASDWPKDPLSPLGTSTPCAVLGHDAGGVPTTTLGATDTAPAKPVVSVALRSGALVAAGGAGTQPSRSLAVIDESGQAYPLPGADTDTLARLGYADAKVAAVTNAWMQFFVFGPDLTRDAAGTSAGGQPIGGGTGGTGATPAPSPAATPVAAPTGVVADAATSGDTCKPGTVQLDANTPSALGVLQSAEVWARATGAGVLVAVVDSGIDANNKHLAGIVVGGVNLVPDGERGDGMSDVAGHGTAIAGLIAAQRIDGSGVVGLAPDARLLSVRVDRGTDDASLKAGFGPTPARVAQGIRWAADHGAAIINVSLSDAVSDTQMRDAVAYAADRGALVVASAGNRTTAANTTDSPRYPAAYPGALAVTAVDAHGVVTDDSIHGPHVEVAAPGSNILTSTTGGGDCLYATTAASSSYATGYTSAAAALVAQAYPDETPAEWKFRLEASATRTNPDARDDRAGWGIIQPLDAITLVPGTDVRGPANPFTATNPVVAQASGTVLHPEDVASPLVSTRDAMLLATILAAIAAGALGILASYRRRNEAPVLAVANRPGILDDMRNDTTRILH